MWWYWKKKNVRNEPTNEIGKESNMSISIWVYLCEYDYIIKYAKWWYIKGEKKECKKMRLLMRWGKEVIGIYLCKYDYIVISMWAYLCGHDYITK